MGTRRGHLVQMFVFEGAAYDLAAALVGAVLGAGVAYLMIIVMAEAFSAQGIDIEYAVTGRSLAIAYALGVLLTLVVVAVSALRVSRMTISTAIRNLPEPPSGARRRRLALAVSGLVLGAVIAVSGAAGGQADAPAARDLADRRQPVPAVRLLGVSDRLAFTGAGLLIALIWMLPWRVLEAVFGELAMDFDVDRGGPDGGRRHRVGHRVQRRPAARRRRGRAGTHPRSP